MTEYAAIHIVFTLQGLRTCTHSPHRRRFVDRLTPRHRSTENETNSYGTILSPQVGMHPLARGRPGVVWTNPTQPYF